MESYHLLSITWPLPAHASSTNPFLDLTVHSFSHWQTPEHPADWSMLPSCSPPPHPRQRSEEPTLRIQTITSNTQYTWARLDRLGNVAGQSHNTRQRSPNNQANGGCGAMSVTVGPMLPLDPLHTSFNPDPLWKNNLASLPNTARPLPPEPALV